MPIFSGIFLVSLFSTIFNLTSGCIPTRSPGDGIIGGIVTVVPTVPVGIDTTTTISALDTTTTTLPTDTTTTTDTTTSTTTTTTTTSTTTSTTSTTTTTTTTTSPCPTGWIYFVMTNACYIVGSGGLIGGWTDAENTCIAMGTFGSMMGHLTSITSQEENDFLVSIAQTGSIIDPLMVPWIGLMRAFQTPPIPNGNPFLWSDGEGVGFTNWLLPPTNPLPFSPADCVQLLSDGIIGFPLGQGSWVSTPCLSVVTKYICKVPL